MPVLNKPIPQSSDNVAFEGGYDPTADATCALEVDSTATANGTTRGPQRVVTSALNGVIGGNGGTQPTTTNVGTDTPWVFASQIRHLMIQNNTAAGVQFGLDAAATLGSPLLAPGATFLADIRVTTVHLLTAAAQNINGATAGNIVLWGWL